MNISTLTYQKLSHTLSVFRIAYCAFFAILGIDKFLTLLAPWYELISPFIERHSILSIGQLGLLSGIIELGIALLLATRWARTGAYFGFAWLLLVAANMLSIKAYLSLWLFYAIAAIGAFVLGRLITIRERISNEAV